MKQKTMEFYYHSSLLKRVWKSLSAAVSNNL